MAANEKEDYEDFSHTCNTAATYGYNVKNNWPGDQREETMAVFGQATLPITGSVAIPAILILAMNFFFTISDLAVDGYAADTLLAEEQSLGSSFQIAGNFVGFMVGGGVFLILYHHLGWQSTLRI